MKSENQTLKARISDLKERTKGVQAFKSVFNDFIDKVKEKAPEGEFERLNRV